VRVEVCGSDGGGKGCGGEGCDGGGGCSDGGGSKLAIVALHWWSW
jgi:hypothetical protein